MIRREHDSERITQAKDSFKLQPVVYHYWVSLQHGYLFSTSKECPLTRISKVKIKYMGFTSDLGWPKKMNTGRLLCKPSPKSKKQKKKKLSLARKTDTVFRKQ